MYEEIEDVREFSYWPSVSDLFMTLFIVALALLVAVYTVFARPFTGKEESVLKTWGGMELSGVQEPTNRMRKALVLPEIAAGQPAGEVMSALSETADAVVNRLQPEKDLRQKLLATEQKLKEKESELEKLKELIGTMGRELAGLKGELNDKPPIIKIAEAGEKGKEEYRFPLGSAAIGKDFKAGLRTGGFSDLAREIVKRNEKRLAVDTLEVIGHTDGRPVPRSGNLDAVLPAFLAGKTDTLEDLTALNGIFNQLTAGSNNDLGLLRALAIKQEWLSFVKEHAQRAILEKLEVRCYSAGQTIPDVAEGLGNSETFRMKNEKFRRIEIRLTKLK